MTLRPILTALFITSSVGSVLYALPCGEAAEQEPMNTLVEQYIAKYHLVAQNEMERTGVSASITLAQGILESTYGQSELATKANNHFGLKCKTNWSGLTYYKDTKEQDLYGNERIAVGECFRNYPTAEACFQDRSNYLSGRANYANLFTLAPDDYKGWAKGLKDAGWATDVDYPQKLINLVEQYDLDKFDEVNTPLFLEPLPLPAPKPPKINQNLSNQELVLEIEKLKERVFTLETSLAEAQNSLLELQTEQATLRAEFDNMSAEEQARNVEMKEKIAILDQNIAEQFAVTEILAGKLNNMESIQDQMLVSDPLSPYFNPDGTERTHVILFPKQESSPTDGIFYINGLKTTELPKGRDLFYIAQVYDIPYTDLLKYNDLEEELATYPEGFYVFLERKENSAENTASTEQIQVGETMYFVSQRYGVRLNKLQQRNHLKEGEEPAFGEFIFLNENAKEKPRLRNTEYDMDAPFQFDGGGTAPANAGR